MLFNILLYYLFHQAFFVLYLSVSVFRRSEGIVAKKSTQLLQFVIMRWGRS